LQKTSDHAGHKTSIKANNERRKQNYNHCL